jgi:ATP-binding protein involved in chromosome partitioning
VTSRIGNPLRGHERLLSVRPPGGIVNNDAYNFAARGDEAPSSALGEEADTQATPSEAQVLAAIGEVIEPELGRPIGELGMVHGVLVRPGRAQATLALVVTGHPHAERIRQDVTDAVRALGVAEVVLDLVIMNDRERARLRRSLQGARTESPDPFRDTRIYAVASGKGGVGKSSIATNLAVAMARRGQRVALLDADVWGFSIPRMMGISRPPVIIDGLLVPLLAHGVRVASVGMLTEESAPVIWRGPMLHKMLEQFVTDVFWDEPDVLVIDMPPGTGDVSLSVARLLPDAEVLIVTTPQPAAQRVAQRAAYMAREVKLRVAGVLENMSWFTGDDGARYELFGAGGGEILADELGVPLLGRIALVPALREGADRGEPVVVRQPDGEVGRALDAAAGRLLDLPPGHIRRPQLRITTAS